MKIAEAANDLAALLEGTQHPVQQRRDKSLAGASRQIQKLLRARFRLQRKAVLDSHALRTLPVAESDSEDRTKLESEIAASLGPLIYHQPVTADEQATYAKAIAKALDSGADAAAGMMDTAAPNTESFIAEYLKDGGFSKLTGDIDKTTVDRLASAVADAYESGADFDGVVQAVKDSFADATAARAKMISQTELNDAFNQSVVHFGREAGATMKMWETDLAPCIICLANEFQGSIALEDDFDSGDDAPPAHPNCFCSLLVTA